MRTWNPGRVQVSTHPSSFSVIVHDCSVPITHSPESML